jgi:autoinducer 2-degrading protein
MIVRLIDVYVNQGQEEAFKAASVQNRAGSMREPGVLRFDLLQDEAQPAHFVLLEVYRDEQATRDHKETAHYQKWRGAVEPMMARPRVGTAYSAVAPTDPGAWKS